MRRCKIAPPSCTQSGTPCCADCGNKACPARCQNSPALCGCWEKAPPPRKRQGAPRKADPLKAAWLYSQGMTQAEIARWLGCHRHTVAQALREVNQNGGS